MHFSQSLISSTFLFLTLSHAQAPTPVGPAIVMATSGTYPRATRLSDSSILGVYAKYASGNSTLTALKSTDNGASWSVLGSIATAPTATTNLDNPFIHQLPSGRILCAFRNHNKATSTQSVFYRITITYSDDLGKTWKYLSTPVSDSASANGDWEPFMMDALDGSLQLYYSRENKGADQDSLLRRSTDGGATWSSAQVISGTDVTARDGMLGVARLAPGSSSMLAAFESGNTTGDNLFTVHTVRSDDDGKTWGSRAPVYSSPRHNAGAPSIVRVGSRLVASFGTDEDGGVWPNGAMKVVVSSDKGKTWGSKTTVRAVPAEWSGLLALDDTSFLAMYESDQTVYARKMAF